MMQELEDILIQLNMGIMRIEDEAFDELSRLEAKKIYIIGVLQQLELELKALEIEYDIASASYFEEEEQTEIFEKSLGEYNEIMSSLFTKH